MLADGYDPLLIVCTDGLRPPERSPGAVLIPVRAPAAKALEPFKEPLLGTVEFTVNGFGQFSF